MRLFDRLGRLPLVIVFGWAVAAALAVSVGVVGIGLVGSGLFAGRAEPLSETEVARALAAEETAAGTSPAASQTPETRGTPETPGTVPISPSPSGDSTSVHTRGGTVIADCRRIISMSPAQGWAVHEQDGDEGEFRNVRNGHQRVKIDLGACTAGLPRLEITIESDDD
ncbi:MAG TPA: hypothetical protein VN408_13955 [Actinoplanes sp.]|nr:hypothetical protein [Actinoplanes sp.]